VGQEFFQTLLQEILDPFYQGTTVFSNPVNGNGQDLTVIQTYKPIAKFEVIDWYVNSIMDVKRAERIRKNLRGVPFKAILGTIPLREKPWNNITPKARKILRPIPKFYTNFQILPPEFYSYFKEKDPELTLFRKLHGISTLELIKKPLEIFLAEIRLIPLITIVRKYSLLSGSCEYVWDESNTNIDGCSYQLYDEELYSFSGKQEEMEGLPI